MPKKKSGAESDSSKPEQPDPESADFETRFNVLLAAVADITLRADVLKRELAELRRL